MKNGLQTNIHQTEFKHKYAEGDWHGSERP